MANPASHEDRVGAVGNIHDNLIIKPECRGSSALSPSGNTLVITNLVDGIDWYSVEERQFLDTTPYESDGVNTYILEVTFLDEMTVVVGSDQSRLIITSRNLANRPYVRTIPGAGGESILS